MASRQAMNGFRQLCALTLLCLSVFTGINAAAQSSSVNLSLDKAINNPNPAIGEVVTYTVTVTNSGTTAATGVVVSESIATGYSTYLSSTASVGTFSYTSATGLGTWAVGSVAPGQTVTLLISARVDAEGVAFSAAEVSAMNETDANSIPGNGSLLEDDYDNACFSVPLSWYAGDEYQVDKPAGFSAVTWLADGQPISASTTNASVDASGNLIIKGPGIFSFQATLNGCPTGNCCNIVVIPGVTASLGDYVFEDKNINGIQDAGDVPIPGVVVTLFQNGSAVATTTTDANGLYSFTGLTPGTSNSYVVGFTKPTGYSATTPLSGSNRNLDSNADPVTGLASAVTLTAGESNTSIDAGYFRPASLGDYAFVDTNKDGIQNAGDTPLPGVVVTLYQNGSAVATTTTDATGLYSFTGLTPGASNSYSVGFTPPANFTTTSPLSGTDRSLDSDADPITGRTQSVTLASGENNTTLDAGYTPLTAGLGDYVFEDKNANGIQDAGDVPIPGVVVTLYQNGSVIRTTTTDGSGLYSFTGLTPGLAYQVGFGTPTGYTRTVANVGSDDALDSDAGTNGLTGLYSLTANEFNSTVDAGFIRPASIGDYVFNDQNKNGIQDAGDTPIPGVVVTLYQNGSAVATTTTDATGLYSFTGLTPGSSISYSVGFGKPSGFEATSANVGFDGLDSDADPITGRTGSYTLSSGESNTSVDAGFYLQTAGLGDYVFEDKNANGIQDAGDLPIPGVLVSLYESGSLVRTTTTDGSGLYSFTGLTPGVPYTVGFGTPTGYTRTLANVGSDDALDSDAGTNGLTGVYSLTANEFNPTVDAGFVRSASIGDYAFVDTNKDGIQNTGDTPLPGVVVTLYQNGSAVATTTTDATGLYSFTGLTPGASNSYSVGFTPPANFTTTSPLSGTDRSLDSDADPITGRTQSVTLASGENNTTLDAGYTPLTAGLGDYVFEDKNLNGTQDAGDVPIPGVVVSLLSNGAVIRTTTTDGSGLYSFTGLTPGVPYSVSFAAPVGYQGTVANVGADNADSDGNAVTGLTGVYSLTANEFNPTVDMGYYRPASLGDYVFNDQNRDGTQNVGEPGIPGVVVTLYQNGSAVATTVTDGSGLYSFTGLTPGASNSYSVGFTTPANYTTTMPLSGTDKALDSDADPITGRTQSVTLASGESNTTLDAGFYLQTAGLGDYVFEDKNANGIQDAGDVPIPGVLVSLYESGSVVRTTTTDGSGLYSFTGLTPGVPYTVGFGTPTGYTRTVANVGSDDALDSDAGTNGLTGAYSLTANEFNPTVDAGFVRSASLGDYVFQDNDKDGTQSAGDTPIPGVVVTLYQNGSAVATTTTDATGLYSFTGLTPGSSNSYSVGFTAPVGYSATTPLSGTDKALDSDADPITGRTVAVTLTSGENNTTIDAGYTTTTARLGNYVFYDRNKDGIQDAGDFPLNGVAVTLYLNGSAVATTATNGDGFYSFIGLTPGTSYSYSVGFTTPVNLTATAAQVGGDDALDSDANPVTGLTRTVTLMPDEYNDRLDAGFYATSDRNDYLASLGDYVFEDVNKNGIQDAGDLPIPGVVVSLFQNGSAVATTTTDGSGLYSFTGLTPGSSNSYSLRFGKPSGFEATSANVGSNDAIDSDASVSTGRTGSYTLTSGENNPTIDAGFIRQTAGLGDYVFEDKNANGIQDAGDVPIPGVLVSLYESGSVVRTTTTDGSGLYSFTGLTPGVPYTVGFGTPTGYTRTVANVGSDDALDSDAGTNGLTGAYSLTANEFNPTVDAGFVRSASIGDYAFVDTNKDGIQNTGDTPLPGVVVTLYQNGSAVATTTTDATGLYSFTGLTPGSSNSYSVGFTPPANFTTTSPLSGTDRSLDSDADPITGRTQSVTLASGENNTTLDAGYTPLTAGLGDYVFEDKNLNGTQDAGDVPIPGVVVSLLSNGAVIRTTTTDGSGLYSFTGLTPGVPYSVSFAAPVGYQGTVANVGADNADSDGNAVTGLTGVYSLTANEFNPTVDMGYYRPASLGDYVFNDQNRDGTQNVGEPGIPGVVVTLYQNGSAVATTTTDGSGLYSFTGLTPGSSISYSVGFGKPSGFDATSANVGFDGLDSDADPITGRTGSYTLSSGESNTSVDAGFYQQLAGLGNYTFEDKNANGIQDAGDVPISGVVVTLFQNGSAVMTTTTDINGAYSFTGLASGPTNVYRVGFTTPAGFGVTTPNAGSDDALDSDLISFTGQTGTYTLTAGQFDPTVDAGFIRPASIGDYVFQDNDRNGVQNAGDTPIPGVVVTLYQNGNPVATTTTDASGLYSFTGLAPGTSFSYSVGFTTPTGYSATTPLSGTDKALDSDADPVTGRTASITLSSGESNTTIDAGFTQPLASLGDYVFDDKNVNGIQDTGDVPIPGVVVTLYQNGSAVATTATNINGLYSFTGLTPGTSNSYSVGFTTPTGYGVTNPQVGGDDVVDSDVNPATGRTRSVTLAAGENNPRLDAGYVKLASIGDYVFNDTDNSNTQTPGDTPIPGVVVTLYQNGSAVATTVTDGSGLYSFTGLTPGSSNSYSVGFTTPVGFTTVTPLVGGNPALDSNVDPLTGRTATFTLTSGESNTTIDAGFRGNTGSIGNYVWFDYNNDGTQGDPAVEPGVSGVTVQLYAANNLTTPIATTTTSSTGAYLFSNLPSGQYVVKFTPLAGTVLATPKRLGVGDELDSDANENGLTDVITIDVTQPISSTARNNPNVDAGIVPFGSIGDFVWIDANKDGLQNDGPNDGIAGVTVQLFGASDLDNPLSETVTDINGKYLFDSLITGFYRVRFILPTGFQFTTAGAGSDAGAIDSNAGPDGFNIGLVNNIFIDTSRPLGSELRDNLTIDAGVYSTSCLTPVVLVAGVSNSSICVGGVTSVSANAAGAVVIRWYQQATGGVASFTTANAQSYTVAPTADVTYYVEAETAEGCVSNRIPVVINVNPRPNTPTLTPREATICLNETYNLTTVQPASPSLPGGTFEWHTTSSETSPLVSNLTAVGAGTFYLFERSQVGCYSVPGVLTVNQIDCRCTNVATVSTTLTSGTACAGDRITLLATIGGSATGVTWMVSNSATAGTLTGANSLTASYLPSAADILAGQVQFTVTTNDPDGNGVCLPAQSTVIVMLSPRPTTVYGASCEDPDATICQGTMTKLIGFADNARIRWTNKATGELVGIVDSGRNLTISPTQTTTYVAQAVAANGCTSLNTVEVVVRVTTCLADLAVQKSVLTAGSYRVGDVVSYGIKAINNGPVPATGVTVSDILPAGLSFVSATPASEYNATTGVWSVGSLNVGSDRSLIVQARVTGTNSTSSIVNVARITGTNDDPTKPENNTSAAGITVDNCGTIPAPTIACAVTSLCGETESTALTARDCAGEIRWSNGMTGTNIIVVPGVTTTYTASCVVGSCTSLASNAITITVTKTPAPVVLASTERTCVGGVVSLSATGCGNGTVYWSNNQIGNVISVTVNADTRYTAQCRVNNCYSPSGEVTIRVGELPKPTVVCSETQVCPGETVTLTVQNCLGTPIWSTGDNTSSIVVLPTAGNSTYSVVCKDGACTSPRSSDYTIRVIPVTNPTIVASTTSVCVGGTVSLTASGCEDGTIYWSNNAVGRVMSTTLVANESFYAYCKVRECVSDPSRAIAISVGRPTAPTIRAIPNTAICAGESVTLTVTEGCANGIVKWSNTVQTGNTIVVTPGSNMTYTATCLVDNCESSRSNEVRVILRTSGTAPTIAASSPSICNGGSVTLTASGCSNGTVIWSNQMTGQSITVAPQQGEVFYAICRLPAACGSPRSNTISINLTTPPAPTVLCSTSVVCPGESVELTIQNCAGTPIWSTGPQDDGKSMITVFPTVTTSYSAICQQGGGANTCLSAPSSLYTITVVPVPVPTISASSTAINPGESVTLTVTNNCPGTVTWSTNETGNSIVVTPTAAVNYYTATCRYRSCTTEPSVRILVRYRGPENCNAKAGTLVAPAAEICASSLTAVTLTATDNGDRVVPTGFSTVYVLTKGNNLVIQQTSPTASFTVPATAAGLYTIHTLVYNPAALDLSVIRPGVTTGTEVLNLIRTNNLCADLDVNGASTTIKYVNPPIIPGPHVIYRCYGEPVSITATGCDNGKVVWSNGVVGSVLSLTMGHYNVWVTATCEIDGCVSAHSEMFDVGVVTPTVPTIGSNKLSVCAGDEATLTAQGCENGSYLWSNGSTTSSITVTPQVSTTYAVKCVMGNCASDWSPVVSLTVGSPGAPVIAAAGAQNGAITTCFGAPVTLTARGCANGAYTVWSNNQVGSSITVTPALSATYTAVCCTSDNCKSVRSNPIVVTVLSKVLQPVVTNLTNTCPFASVNLTSAVGAVATTGGSFEYYTTADLNPASKLANTNVTVSGTYYVVEKTTGGCYSLPTAIQVQIRACGDILPCDNNPVTVNAGVDDAICAAKTYKLKGSTTGQNVTVQWTTSGTGTFDNAFSPTALYTASAADVQAGQVTLTLSAKTNNTQCAPQTDAMVLKLNGPSVQPTIAVAGATQLCAGGSVVLSAPAGAGYTYQWTGTSATSQSITVASSGTYTVQVVDANGCSSVASAPVVVNVAAPVAAPVVANLRNTCPATTVDLSNALSMTTAGSTYEFRMGNTPTSPMVMNPATAGAGTYYIFEQTAAQCVSLPAQVVVKVFDCTNSTQSADVVMTKLVNNTSPKVGEALTYTLKVTNNGPDKAYNVDIRDVLPTGLNLVVGNSPLNYTVANGSILKRFDSLAVGASDSIVFVARLSKKGAVVNTASITYSDVNDPGTANNTASVTVTDSSPFRPGTIGLAKNIVGQPRLVNDSTVAVRYAFTLTNFGDEDLTNVGVTDDLGAVFGVANLRSVSLSATDPTLTVNPVYSGTGTDTQLLGANGTLAAGQTTTFVMDVTAAVTPSQSYTFSNTARATATNTTATVTDDSVDGLDADPDKDGDPTNNSGSSTFFITVPSAQTAQLGVALAVDGIAKQADDSYNVTYKVYVKNFGTTPLTNVSLIDSVGVSFPAPASFSIVSAPTVNAGSELVISSDFNGTSAPYYLNGMVSRLAAGKQDTITYVINVKPNGNGPFYSQIYATAKPEGSTETLSDRSNAGSVIVPSDNSKTMVRFDLPSALLGVAKEVGTPIRVADNVWDVPYIIKVCNLGSVGLSQVQVVDDLSATFGSGAQVVSVSLTADAGLKVNPNYTGVGLLTNLLDTTASSLPAKAIRYVQLMARVDVSKATSLTFTNLAIGSAMNGSVAVRDTSNAGSNVDPDNDLDPRNNNRGTFVVLNSLPGAPHVGVAMMVQDTARQANGTYDVTYRVVVKNYGTVKLTNVALSDTLTNTFNQQVGASYSVLGMPIASAGSKLKLNPGFNGGADPMLVLGDSTSTLAAGATDTLRIRINVASTGVTGTFFNTVYAVAKAGAETVRDASTNGMNPDPNGNNNPTDLTEREATPLFLPLSLETVFIPEGFSPNGDGVNDLFVIRGTQGTTVKLEVFNRWGHRVYVSEDYKNDWDGTSNTGVQISSGDGGNALPVGTYYYVVRLSDGREFVRYLTLSR
ncbi:SdrD B-like domain-containing protein [Fibrella sp. WM1]|uniref:SdrD B-like domain-containing protein n=1 Tax=Fibrella musci TaxID=3242485 RepID=UPI00351FB9AB